MNCDLCQKNQAVYDARIPSVGSWANVCQSCFINQGCCLGVGHGQKLKDPRDFKVYKATKEEINTRTQEALKELCDEELEELIIDSVCPTACPEGCEVEPDGRCYHGYPSLLMALGII